MIRAATAPRPMSATSAPNPGEAVAAGVGAVVGALVGAVVGAEVGALVGATVADPVRMLNVVVVVQSASMASTFTMYSSALKVDASTSSAHSLYEEPSVTFTVEETPENSPLCVFWVGWKDDDVTSTMRSSPIARLVVPVILNWSPM